MYKYHNTVMINLIIVIEIYDWIVWMATQYCQTMMVKDPMLGLPFTGTPTHTIVKLYRFHIVFYNRFRTYFSLGRWKSDDGGDELRWLFS